jgi:hypothetical protein
VTSRIVLRAEGTRVVGEVATGSDGWPWVEIDFPGQRGKGLTCGFALMSKWEAGPTPRFLFARLLERFSGEGAAGMTGVNNPAKEPCPSRTHLV